MVQPEVLKKSGEGLDVVAGDLKRDGGQAVRSIELLSAVVGGWELGGALAHLQERWDAKINAATQTMNRQAQSLRDVATAWTAWTARDASVAGTFTSTPLGGR
jgi:hypothetical protein